jgi:hypothetical protein
MALRRFFDDGGVNDVHPIPDAPDWPIDRRVHHLECALSILWDHVWWRSLPWYRRLYYTAQGFKAPIGRFYVPLDEVSRAGN